jgi:hypothetical protein
LEDANAAPHGGGWLEMAFAINGDWGAVPGTMYLDNIQLNLVPEPTTLSILGLAALAVWPAMRRRLGR